MGEFFMPDRFLVLKFDGNTYQIIDSAENCEICVCSNYDDFDDARERAEKIVKILNLNEEII